MDNQKTKQKIVCLRIRKCFMLLGCLVNSDHCYTLQIRRGIEDFVREAFNVSYVYIYTHNL